MRTDGWIFMLISWTVILGLLGYSMARTLFGKHRDGEDRQD